MRLHRYHGIRPSTAFRIIARSRHKRAHAIKTNDGWKIFSKRKNGTFETLARGPHDNGTASMNAAITDLLNERSKGIKRVIVHGPMGQIEEEWTRKNIGAIQSDRSHAPE